MKKFIQILGYCFLIYIWLFWFGHLLHAQSQTTVTGVVFDSGGNPATSGFVEFDLQPQASGVQFTVPGIGVIAPQNTVCGIDGSGNVKNLTNLANPCLVWGNSVVSPANTTYTVQIAPGGVVSNVVSQECINGASYSLASPVFCPRLSLNPQSAFVITTPIQQNLIPGVDAVFNLGSSLNRYANLFSANGTFTNLTLLNTLVAPTLSISGNATVGGTLGVTGLTTLNSGTLNGTFGGNPTLSGNVLIGSTLGVTGAITGSSLNLSSTGVLSTTAQSGTGSLCMTTNCVMTTPNIDGATATSITTSSANPATIGLIRGANNTTLVASRNAANTSNVSALSVTSLDQVALGLGPFLIPSVGDTAVGKATTDTLTNKTLTAPVINGTSSGTGIPTQTLKKGSGAGNYTTTSTTYAVVDATNLCYTTLIPVGWKLSVQAHMPAGTNTAVVAFNVALTDNASCATANAGLLQETAIQGNGVGTGVTVSLGWVVVGDGATHNIALQYKTSNAADAVFIANGSASFLPVMILNLTPSN